ncbi:MAG: tetratricopeptide (TPR) repeat protein [Flammeovirgaceae bacterium]|jgi:tetratricopeptide (TPR) repeat protein
MKNFLAVFSLLLFFLQASAQNTSSDFYSRYVAAMESGQIQTAISIAQEWKEQDKSDINPFYFSAKALAKKGRKKEAFENLEQALGIDSTHIPSLIAIAELSKKSSNTDALVIYEKLIVINPSNAYFYREAAESAVEVQKFDKAIAYYSLAYQFDSLDLITITGFAQLLLDFQQHADADSLLNRALHIDPPNRFARLTKAKLGFAAEEWEEVLKWVEPLMSDTPPLTAMRYAGISLYHLGRYEEAIEVLRTLSNVLNELDYPHYYMGLCMEKLGQIDMATVQYGQALNKALSGNLGTYYERLGLIQQESRNHKEAIDSFLMAKKFSGRNIMNFYLAKSYDVYYQDQKIALNMFETFIAQEDTLKNSEKEYAESRVDQLKKDLHFDGN